MGIFSKLFMNRKNYRILMVGLDCVGKTTILYKLKLGSIVHTIPTIGFNVETIQYKNIEFTVCDMGGQEKIRSLWRHYYYDTQGIIFVIDSNDKNRFRESIIEFNKILSEPLLKDSTLLIFANKYDLHDVMSLSEISTELKLDKLIDRKWTLQMCSGLSGEGIYEGLEWLSNNI